MSKITKCLSVIIFTTFCCVIIVGCTSSHEAEAPLQKWEQLMQKGNYQEAVMNLDNNYDADNNEIIVEEISNSVNKIQTDFIQGTLSYSEALAQLSTIKEMGYEVELIDDTIKYIGKLDASNFAFEFAEEMFNQQEYIVAISYYKQVVEDDVNYSYALEKIGIALLNYRADAISESEALQELHSYDEAIVKIQEAIFALNEDPALVDYKNSIYQNAIIYYEDLAIDAQASQNYLQAVEYLKLADSYDVNNEKHYESQINSLFDSYFNIYLEQADAVFLSPYEDYLEAAAILKPILDAYPYATSIKEKYMYYMSYQPIPLFEQDPFQKSTYFASSPSEGRLDNRGNEHSLMYTCGAIYEVDADWKLAKEYNRLTGIVGVPAGNYDTGVNGKIQIYGDGVLLWEKVGIDAETAPETISVDISGVDVLQIYMEGGIGSLMKCTVMIADFQIYKIQQ